MGAKIILNSRYFHVAKSGEKADGKNILTKDSAAGLVNYVGTRETVALNIDKEYSDYKASFKQQKLINELIEEFPEVKDTHEYRDFLEDKTIKTASEFISRATELATMEHLTLGNGTIPKDEVSNLVEYVANRPGVVKVGNHGLFGAEGNANLKEAMDNIANHQGNIWTHVISLRREDANRLGFDSQSPWQELIKKHIDVIASNSKISLNNIQWYAGMHNTGHHPHIHLFIYSKNPKEGFINKAGLEQIKSSFAHDIFADDLKEIYSQKTEYRNQLKTKAEEILEEITDNPKGQYSENNLKELCNKLERLSDNLPDKGKLVYGFQSNKIKKQIDDILQIMVEKSPDLSKLYGEWCKEQLTIESTYINNPNKEYPIAENDEFRSLKNRILDEAKNIKQKSEPQPEKTMVEVFNIENQNNKTDSYEISNCPPTYTDYTAEAIYTFENKTSDDNWNENFEQLKYRAEDVENRTAEDCYRLAKCYLHGKDTAADTYKSQMWFGIAAGKGHSMAKYEIGKMYLYGNKIEQDIKLGNEYCKEAYYGLGLSLNDTRLFYDIKDNNSMLETELVINDDNTFSEQEVPKQYKTENKYGAYSQYICGLICLKGEGVEQDYTKAEKWFENAAQNGYALAYYYLGNMAYYGLGQEQNYYKALDMYLLAADKNNAPAISYRIGSMYEQANGTEINLFGAVSWYKKAADDNHSYAQYKLGELYGDEKNTFYNTETSHSYYSQALNQFQKDYAEEPQPSTAYRIGSMYEQGNGTEINLFEAVSWYERAADDNHSYAQYKLGELYGDEKTVMYNPYKSQMYYSKALENFKAEYAKDPNEQTAYRLASMYEFGKGTTKNYFKAIEWYEKAAEKNHAYAQCKLGDIYNNKDFGGYNPEIASQYYRKSLNTFTADFAQNPDSNIALKIGAFYHYGKGLERDLVEAEKWYTKALNMGNENAGEQLQKLKQSESQLNPQASIFSLLSHIAKSINNDHQNNLKQKYTPDKKLRMQQKRQKIAMGQNEQDHEMEIEY